MEPEIFEYTNTKGVKYYLNGKMVQLKNGNGAYPIYFFSKDARAETGLTELPDGREVGETKNGLPVLRKVCKH